MNLETIFYIVGIIALSLNIIIVIGLAIGAYIITKRAKKIKHTFQTALTTSVLALAPKVGWIPIVWTLVKKILPKSSK